MKKVYDVTVTEEILVGVRYRRTFRATVSKRLTFPSPTYDGVEHFKVIVMPDGSAYTKYRTPRSSPRLGDLGPFRAAAIRAVRRLLKDETRSRT